MKIDLNKYILKLKEENILLSYRLTEKIEIEGITFDSRQVSQNWAFIAIKGLTSDGNKFIEKAEEQGSSLVVYSSKEKSVKTNSILVTDSRKAGSILACLYYDNPSSKLKVIGITGTNGKTTTSTIICDVLNKSGIKCGSIGTLGYSFDNKETISHSRTTPDFVELNAILASMVKQDCQAVVMEVSSHSLVLNRVHSIQFDAIGFTNLTQDHLDFHKDFESYFNAKKMLFDIAFNQKAFAVINTDDQFGKKYYSEFNGDKISYGSQAISDYQISDIRSHDKGTAYTLIEQKSNNNLQIVSNYYGLFNAYNLTLAHLICSKLYGSITPKIYSSLKKTSGRLEYIESKSLAKVFLDYAHTPDAVQQVITTLKETKAKRLITVLGCGGNRDQAKRPLMAKRATLLSDFVIFTDDNPRKEKNYSIIYDMVKDLSSDNYIIIRDRKRAINTALDIAKSDSIVAILGKGHEDYQEIGDRKTPFSDKKVIQDFIHVEKAENRLHVDLDIINLYDLAEKHNHEFDWSKIDIPDQYIENISTDSRSITEKSLFIALKGDNFDGNNYIDSVLENTEEAFAVGTSDIDKTNYLKVEDSLEFYGILANRYLSIFDLTKIAITGSTGKTTTKEILANIIRESSNVLVTRGNENNYIGLPRTIFRAKANQSYAVLEIGTNAPGEINYLSNIIKPDYAIITSVDQAHLELLGSLEGVYQEKTDIFRRELKAFLFPGDNILFNEFKEEFYNNLGYSLGQKESNDFTYEVTQFKNDSFELSINNSSYEVNCPIPYFAHNYSLAITLAKLLGLANYTITRGLSNQLKLNNRMSFASKDTNIFIVDCYNANPASTKAAIDFWSNYKNEKKHVAILGDMLELGTQSLELHKNIGKQLTLIKDKVVYSVGRDSINYLANKHFDNVESFLSENLINDFKDCVVLIKGSHGIHLEKIMEKIDAVSFV